MLITETRPVFSAKSSSLKTRHATVSERDIPILAETELLVVGASSAAVAAAVRAAEAGVRVYLVAPRTYFGEDLAGTLRLWLDPDESPNGTLAEKIWQGERFVTPAMLKKRLQDLLLEARVELIYGAYATELLVDSDGNPRGVVVSNRAGLQAITAEVVIDATPAASLAKLAGAVFVDRKKSARTAKWMVIAENANARESVGVRELSLPLTVTNKSGSAPIPSKARWLEYSLPLDEEADTFEARNALAQTIRDLAYNPTQLYSAEEPFVVSTRKIEASHSESPELRAFRPLGMKRLWVLNGCAAVPDEAVESLLRPIAFMAAGEQVGFAAVEEFKKIKSEKSDARQAEISVFVRNHVAEHVGEIKEIVSGIRPLPKPKTIHKPASSLPILGEYDVVVAGGGTSGAPAGIAASRRGAKTLVVESLYGLGGVGTLGMIGAYWKGNRVGFTTTIPQNPIEVRMEWYRKELRKCGADIWFGVTSHGAVLNKDKVVGLVVATAEGPGIVLAKTVIDASGNADIAVAAGAESAFVEEDFALQESHYARREVGSSYTNGGRPSVADADPLQMREALRKRSEKPFDWSPLFNTRERRRIVGDYVLDWLDQINCRTFPDAICHARSDYDSHGYQIHPFFQMRPARVPGDYDKQFESDVPYRSLLPRGFEGILVVGLGLSAHRDAVPIVRMQPDLHNLGYAAGFAAALACESNCALREIDITSLQRHLVEIGNLSPDVVGQGDSYPLPLEKISQAAADVAKDFFHLEILMASPEVAIPLLKKKLSAASGQAQVRYAQVLAVLGDSTGLPVLLDECESLIRENRLPDPKQVTTPRSQSDSDDFGRLAWALGYTRDERAAVALLKLLPFIPRADLLNFRAVIVSLGRMANPAAAPQLKKVLEECLAALREKETSLAGLSEDELEIFEGSESAGKEPIFLTEPRMHGRAVSVANDQPGLDEWRIRSLITASALFKCGDLDEAGENALRLFVTGFSGTHAALAWDLLCRRAPSIRGK